MPESEPVLLQLADLTLDPRLECRASRDPAIVEEYAEALEKEVPFPPIEVYTVDGVRYVTDGWTRVAAAKAAGYTEIWANEYAGTFDDAAKAAFESNRGHGQRLTNADKRRIVANALALWPKLSSREIAKRCGSNHQLVEDVRSQLDDSSSSTRVGADGKERKVPDKSKKPKKQADKPPQDEPDDEPEDSQDDTGGKDAPPSGFERAKEWLTTRAKNIRQVRADVVELHEHLLAVGPDSEAYQQIIAERPEGVYLNTQEADRLLREAATTLEYASPAGDCERCSGTGQGKAGRCESCRGSGWISKQQARITQKGVKE